MLKDQNENIQYQLEILFSIEIDVNQSVSL